MSNNGYKITAPVTTRDIQLVLGTAETRQSALCTNKTINKWSKIKPIPYPTNGERCPNFKGTFSQNSSGVFYGLKAGTGYNLNGVDIHNANWEYIKPHGGIGIAPFRRLDFDGYNHKARPTLYGYIVTQEAGKVIYSRTNPFDFYLVWNYTNNTDGVDVATCFPSASDNMANWYLCVMIGDTATALLNDTGLRQPIGNYTSRDALYRCPALPDSLKAVAAERQVTFFLADINSSAIPEVKGMLTGWSKFIDETTLDVSIITVPEAVDYRLEWADTAIDYGKLTRFTVGYNSSTSLFTIEAEWSVKPSQDRKYIGYFQLTNSAGEKSDKVSGTYTGGSGSKDDFFMRISKSALGIRIDSGTYTYAIEVYGYNNNVESQEAVGTAIGTISITV